jgi:acyl carrier protein
MAPLPLDRPPASELAELEGRVQRILRERMNVEEPDVTADLFASGALDSLSLVELLLAIGDEFGVEIPIEELELEDFRSIRSIATRLLRAGVAA